MAGAPGCRARCTRASTNVGDVTGPSTSMASAIPLASTVFPAPKGPDSTTTSPARNSVPNLAPSALVSSAVGSSAVPADRSATAPGPIAYPPSHRDEFRRRGAFAQPDERVVDDVGLFE